MANTDGDAKIYKITVPTEPPSTVYVDAENLRTVVRSISEEYNYVPTVEPVAEGEGAIGE